MTDLEVPVLIVGGGGAGLTASMTLTTLGVDSLLVNSLPNTSVLPKAHVLNQRTMEIFTEAGTTSDRTSSGTSKTPQAISPSTTPTWTASSTTSCGNPGSGKDCTGYTTGDRRRPRRSCCPTTSRH